MGNEQGAAAADPTVPTFHNNRWPLLTELLERKGWVRAADGQFADLSFFDDGAYHKENDSGQPPSPTHRQGHGGSPEPNPHAHPSFAPIGTDVQGTKAGWPFFLARSLTS